MGVQGCILVAWGGDGVWWHATSGNSFVCGLCGLEIPPCKHQGAAQGVETLTEQIWSLKYGVKPARAAAGIFAASGCHLLMSHLMDNQSLTVHLCSYLYLSHLFMSLLLL